MKSEEKPGPYTFGIHQSSLATVEGFARCSLLVPITPCQTFHYFEFYFRELKFRYHECFAIISFTKHE